MLCPLCQTEYPSGAAECRACRVALVAGSEAPGAARVELWSGADRRKFDELLAALDAADLPNYGEERTSGDSGEGFRFVPERPGFECAVWVLGKDAKRAEAILQTVEQAEEAKDPGVDEGGGK